MLDYKKELEEFAYIVSHDLNAPLRHTREFGKLLVKRLDDKVTDEEREYLIYMESSIHRAESMLEALLQYSRLNTRGEPFEDFDCAALVQDVLFDFKDEINDESYSIQISGLPSNLNGDAGQIRLLFYCLLDNAIKFRDHNRKTIIDITAKSQDKKWLFCISDNGTGIPENQYEAVFKLFKRLNPEADHAGTGIGLTLSQKVVQRHNGKIWIEKNPKSPGHGVCVKFSLPGI